jgi:hypothetical protein
VPPLLQYAPYDIEEDKKYKKGIFNIQIQDLNIKNDLREKIIQDNPTWLKDHKDNKKDYLKQRVVIKIFEKFSYSLFFTHRM